MAAKRDVVPVPDILAVTEDHSEERSGVGCPTSSDVLSIYNKGGLSYTLDDRKYDFTPPVAMLIPKGTVDSDTQVGRVDGIFLLFQGHGLVKRLRSRAGMVHVSLGVSKISVPVLKRISLAEASEMTAILAQIASVSAAGVAGNMERSGLLMQVIAQYCQIVDRAERTGVHREAMRLRVLIEEYAFEQTSMADIYAGMELSAAHAGVLFKNAFGLSPVAYRTQLRLMKARELLVSSQRNVTQVAYETGFSDPLYFSRVFRVEFGVTPSSLIYDFDSTRKR